MKFQVRATRDRNRKKGEGGNVEWKLSEVNTKAVSRGENELIGVFKMAAVNVISISTWFFFPLKY